jgi:hypothetical protein
MKAFPWRKRITLLALLVAGLACKDSSGPGGGGVNFPALPSSLLTAFCHRGNRTVGQTPSGTVNSSDCDAGDSWYEIWRVRVASTQSVTFDANSSFDNFLEVVRLDSYSGDTVYVTEVGENDDRTPGSNLNALVTITLQANTDYFVSISGYDYTETGSYTLQIR